MSVDQGLENGIKMGFRNVFFHCIVKARRVKQHCSDAFSESWCFVQLLHKIMERGESTADSTHVSCLQLSLEELKSKSPSQVFPAAVR